MDALALIHEQVDWCEREGVSVLCCPEAILGGLEDHDAGAWGSATRIPTAEVEERLAVLASDRVATIVGFTELAEDGRIYNAVAVSLGGRVLGVYRKLHPAIRRSVYAAGSETPVFSVEGVCFGVVICNDSNFAEPARAMAAQGARALFVPSNNALPRAKAHPGVIAEARRADSKLARENEVWVVRADVAGECDGLLSYGATAVVAPDGSEVAEALAQRTATIAVDLMVD